MKPMPKNLCELLPIFAVFYNNINQSEPFLVTENAEILIFRPQILNKQEVMVFHFRLYVRVSGSMFQGCNENPQFCGDVIYSLNLATGELQRKETKLKLHDVLTVKADVQSYLDSI
jgi:hypothetical protein